MGPVTHITQPCDLQLNAKMKKLIDELVLLAPSDQRLTRFSSRSQESSKVMVLDEILKERWPMTYRSEDMCKAYDQSGWTLDPLKAGKTDKNILSHYFKFPVGEEQSNRLPKAILRNIDPSKESIANLLIKSSTPGPKPSSIGTRAHKFCGQMVRKLLQEEAGGDEKDVRVQYLRKVRSVAIK